MQLELKPANKLTYKLRLTPQMRSVISLLQMPLVKLQEYVKKQIEENPLLEIDPVRNTKAIKGENKISNGVKAKGQNDSLACQIIDKYLPYLEKKRFEFIAKKLSAKGARLPDGQGSASGGKVTVERIKEAIKEIANLEPKPGRSFNTERAVRLIPDAILKRNNDKYEVMLNDWELPILNLNPKYKRMLKQEDIAEDTKEYLKERLKAAKFLIKTPFSNHNSILFSGKSVHSIFSR